MSVARPRAADLLARRQRRSSSERAEGFPVCSRFGDFSRTDLMRVSASKAPSSARALPMPLKPRDLERPIGKGSTRCRVNTCSKHRYSSFYGTAFNEYLREHDAEYLVICGSSTGNCVITTVMNGWERNYKVIVLADTGTAIPLYRAGAIPLWNQEVPLGYGQHWEALRNIQASYGDVMTHDEFFELIDRS